ncbi:replication-relaxation family protein [Actinocorallia longicatena]
MLLNHRDRRILDLVWEHRVLTTFQIGAVFFTSPKTTRKVLARLHHAGALERFQPRSDDRGSIPIRWTLAPAGAYAVAAMRGQTVKELRYRRDHLHQFVLSQKLNHHLGVADFFTSLHAHARLHEDRNVEQWWSERACFTEWGDLAQPDAFGRWTEPVNGAPTALEFFLEHDTGTETLARVAAKLPGYAKVMTRHRIRVPILFWLPNPTREANLRALLGTPAVPIATAVNTMGTAPGGPVPGDRTANGPAGPVWLPAGTTGPRRTLIGLRTAWDAHNRPRPITPPGV